MSVCEECNREMLVARSCKPWVVTYEDEGSYYDPIKYGDERHMEGERDCRSDYPSHYIDRCHDCGIEEGGLHHPRCDMEECPRCHGQLISCKCPLA